MLPSYSKGSEVILDPGAIIFEFHTLSTWAMFSVPCQVSSGFHCKKIFHIVSILKEKNQKNNAIQNKESFSIIRTKQTFEKKKRLPQI